MQSSSISQTRPLAITLPCLTFLTHTFLVLFGLHIYTSVAPDAETFRPTSGFTIYNSFAAGASMFGLCGAVRWKPALVSAYTTIHAVTLLLGTLTLLDVVLPFSIHRVAPIIPNVHMDSTIICRDIDDGFGWDAAWVESCRTSFKVVELFTCWVGLVLVAVQWCAVVMVWRWGTSLREERAQRIRESKVDIENGGNDEKAHDVQEAEKELGLSL